MANSGRQTPHNNKLYYLQDYTYLQSLSFFVILLLWRLSLSDSDLQVFVLDHLSKALCHSLFLAMCPGQLLLAAPHAYCALARLDVTELAIACSCSARAKGNVASMISHATWHSCSGKAVDSTRKNSATLETLSKWDHMQRHTVPFCAIQTFVTDLLGHARVHNSLAQH